jgi:Uma2 family endonuclease
MSERLTVYGYLSGEESLRRTELVWGRVREPAAPRYGHQSVVTRMTVLLDQHARETGVGRVCVSPIDVVLDAPRALIVQPDVVFVSHRRASIIREQIWGAPDLVVEVLSPGTRRRDRTSKLGWYRRYRVEEYWMVDPAMKTITIVTFPEKGRVRRRTFRGARAVASTVLPAFDAPASALFN